MAQTKIQSEQIEDSAVVTDRIGADAVTTAKIADDVGLGGNPTTTTQSSSDNTTKVATTAYVTTAIANLIDSAPDALNTLNELADALNDQANFGSTVTTSIAAKLPLAGGTMTGALVGTLATFVSGSDTQGKFSGWSPTGANGASGAIELGQTSAYQGIISYAADATTALYFDNTYDHASAKTQFRMRTAGTDVNALTILGSGNVGIGTDDPSYPLEIVDSSANAPGTALKVYSAQNSAAADGLVFIHSDQSLAPFTALNVRQDGTGDILNLLDGTDEVFTVLNGGNVGIGTNDPDEKLHVSGQGSFEQAGNTNRGNVILGAHGSGTAKWATLGATHYNDATGSGSGTGAAGCMMIGNYSDASATTIYIGGGPYELNPATHIKFNTHSSNLHNLGGTTRMIIDSSGNLIVSGTSAGDATSVALHNGGYVHAVSSHQMAGIFDRRDSDGDIILLRKDGAGAGSIGTYSSTIQVGQGNVYLKFANATDTITPANGNGTDNDDAIDIGVSAARFKNLYLSDTVHARKYRLKNGTTTTGGLFHEKDLVGSGSSYDTSVFAETGNAIHFMVNGSATPVGTFDTSGNVGIGITPESWHTSYTALQFAGNGALSGWGNQQAGAAIFLSQNSYSDPTNWKYISTDEASRYEQVNGAHTFSVAPSGTADAAITWTTGFEVLNDGKARAKNGLLFGTDTAAANALDDYEEVNFTATLRGSTTEPSTLLTVTGFATKIGRVVQYSIGYENVDTTGYAGNVSFTGLPYTNDGGRAIGNIVGYLGITFPNTQFFSVIGVASTLLQPHSISSAGTWALTTHNPGSGRYFWLTGTYLTTA